MKYDVLVVGCGAAGLSAALMAANDGARVAILERSTKAERGGNSRYTEAFMRMIDETAVSEDFEERLFKNAMGHIDPNFLPILLKPYDQWPPLLRALGFTDHLLVSTLADGVPAAIAWLKSYGIRFLETTPFLTQVAKRMAPSGGGLVIVETLAEVAEKQGIDFHYETTARSLIQNGKGEVKGVHAWTPSEGNKDIEADTVVLACGGFEGNLEMLGKYIGYYAYRTRPPARGGLYNKGEGIRMALEIGAAPAGQYSDFHSEPIDPRSGVSEPDVPLFNYGILVNRLGERFVDEGKDTADLSSEVITQAIVRQPEGIAYLIFDAKINDVPNYKKVLGTDKAPVAADSIEKLAKRLEIDPVGLRKTIKSFNEAVQEGEFRPLDLDGKCTKGIEPPKSNWARVIDETGLLAYPLICACVFTLGGLKVNSRAEVVNCDGYAIPGLYAAGEIMGIYYGAYVGSTSVLKALVFGRIAGQCAAEFCGGIK
jgi:tricarballylate dehydrogenase